MIIKNIKMKTLSILLLIFSTSISAFGQKYMTQSGQIQFFSKTPVENIEAINNQVSSVINLDNGEMAFSLLMKAFVFEKALMQEHFNEKYVESDKYPKATFKGTIQDFTALNLSSTAQTVHVKGILSIHGVSKEIETTASLSLADEIVSGQCRFVVALDDYGIKVPSVVKDNIASRIEITVDISYEKL